MRERPLGLQQGMAEMKKAELVFIPAPGVGHLVSTVEVANLLISQNDHLSITILIMTRPSDTSILSYKKSLTESSDSRIRYVDLLQEATGPSQVTFGSGFMYEFIDNHKAHVREILGEISSSAESKLAGMVVDMFCTSMFDVANEFGVPSYVFYASGAAMLGLVLHLQSLRDDFGQDVTDYKNSDVEIAIPTYINPVPIKVLPSTIFDKEGGSRMFLNQAKRHREAKGIIINSFRELEPHAIEALSNDNTVPTVYPIGPLLNLKGGNNQKQEAESIMKWLDLQPHTSVVFLCFGSVGTFDGDQVKEIAYALERSGYRFLWSLRKPAPKGRIGSPCDYENPEEILPEGFLQRTANIGKVIGWAPQGAILSHPSVGGFVSHCGWNSILESVWCGVPVATWPLYAEQQVNAFLMVKDLRMAVEIKMDYRRSMLAAPELNSADVTADVIEKGIRLVMDPESEVRRKVKEMQTNSKVVLKEGGSSSSSLRCFIDDVISNVL